MPDYSIRPPRVRRTAGGPNPTLNILSPRSPDASAVSERMLSARQLQQDVFETEQGTRYELTPVLAQGKTADFHLGRRTGPGGGQVIVGIKALVNGEVPKMELETMIKARSPLTACVVTTEERAYLEVPLCDNSLSQAASHVRAANLSHGSVEAWAIDVLMQTSKRLAFMHGQKILHRDVKPANIFVKLDGRVFLGDFGSAAGLYDNVALNGTPGFWTPDTLQGFPVGRADDVWMLGVSALEMVMDHNLFDPERELASASDDDYLKLMFPVMREHMNAYLAWRDPSARLLTTGRAAMSTERMDALKATTADYFAAFEARAPRLAAIVNEMLTPKASARPSIDDVHKRLTELQANDTAETRKDVWAAVQRDPNIQAMIDAFDPATATSARQSARSFEPVPQGSTSLTNPFEGL